MGLRGGPADRGPTHPAKFGVWPARGSKVYTLTGQVLSGAGQAIVGATVYLLDWPSFTVIATTMTDATGSYVFNPPTNGTYKCSFHLSGAPNKFGITDVLVPS